MMPVNKDGDPIPWMNYPTIKFLDRNLTDDMDVFEWGSGNSTKWFADRVDTVVSIEHDPDWASHIEPELPDNSHLIIESDRQEYSSVIQETIDLAEFGGFDVVLIDGQWRVDCARAAVGSLSDDGVVLLDDATRQSYSEGRDILSKEGYDHIILEGIKPLNRNYSSTAIYYRSNNCLGI
jgi:predicted O-methyltransferase YrrM